MIDENNYDRIIGDFIEVNAAIVNDQYYSKYPKFIAKIIAKQQRKKLLKAVKKLRNSNLILNSNNLYEFFIILYNNFPPEGKFGDIVRVLYNQEQNSIEGALIFDNYTVLISMVHSDTGLFDIKAKKTMNGDSIGIDLTTKELTSKNKDYEDIYKTINHQILYNICDYIEYTINLYMEDKK